MSQIQSTRIKNSYSVTTAQIEAIPLSCPMHDSVLWNAHPKVFLPIMKTGKATCPYCSAEYVLTDFDPNKSTDITDTESE